MSAAGLAGASAAGGIAESLGGIAKEGIHQGIAFLMTPVRVEFTGPGIFRSGRNRRIRGTKQSQVNKTGVSAVEVPTGLVLLAFALATGWRPGGLIGAAMGALSGEQGRDALRGVALTTSPLAAALTGEGPLGFLHYLLPRNLQGAALP